MINQLQPWHENISKRQVKAPKVFFRDTGLLHGLLDLPDLNALYGHPRVGASWEGFVIEQILQSINIKQAYFWSTHSGAEVDLFLIHHGRRYAFEVKLSESIKITRSMRIALKDLQLDHLWIIYPGQHEYPVDKKISVWPISKINDLPALTGSF